MTTRKLHRINAVILAVFLIAHLFNHLVGLTGWQNHIAMMDSLRSVYRIKFVEIMIFILFGMQIILGVTLIIQRGRPNSNWAWLQVSSGVVLALFLVQHLFAVALLRLTYSGLDTNFFWASSVIQAKPVGWYFLPYYALGLFAIFAHAAAAFHFVAPQKTRMKYSLICAGLFMGLAVPASLSGLMFPVDLPLEYREYIDVFYPDWLASLN